MVGYLIQVDPYFMVFAQECFLGFHGFIYVVVDFGFVVDDPVTDVFCEGHVLFLCFFGEEGVFCFGDSYGDSFGFRVFFFGTAHFYSPFFFHAKRAVSEANHKGTKCPHWGPGA